ncbi:hypothetical protein, partial [Mesorhizobium intechi]|uniref:hypothetical protein n=1 Tax=Mesorhizobium intechi TaxID=537601 RepID=UPI001ABFDEFE
VGSVGKARSGRVVYRTVANDQQFFNKRPYRCNQVKIVLIYLAFLIVIKCDCQAPHRPISLVQWHLELERSDKGSPAASNHILPRKHHREAVLPGCAFDARDSVEKQVFQERWLEWHHLARRRPQPLNHSVSTKKTDHMLSSMRSRDEACQMKPAFQEKAHSVFAMPGV